MASPTSIELELSGRGNGWTSVAADVMLEPGPNYHRGLPGPRVTDCVADIGVLHFVLDNSETNSGAKLGYYSPDHANCRTGFALNIGVRYKVGTLVRFTGQLSAIDPTPGLKGPRRVWCEAVDWIDVATRTRLSGIPVQVNQTGDQVFQTLISSLAVSSQPLAVEKDASPDTYPYTLDQIKDEQTVLHDELARLVLSGLDRCWVRGNGTLVYESRTRRAKAATDLDTFTDSNGFIASRDRTGVVNKVQSTVHPRLPGVSNVVLYSLNQPMALSPGQTVNVLGPWTDPANPTVRVGAVSLVSLTATTDYTANTAADGSGTNLTASLAITVGLSGNATAFAITLGGVQSGFLTKLQQRGEPLFDYGPTVMAAQDDTSIGAYGLQLLPIDMAYQANPIFGLEASQYIVFTSSNPLTQVSGLRRYIPFTNATELARSTMRDISDRVRLTDTVTGISRSFFIQAIDEQEIAGKMLQTDFALVPADTTAFWLLEIAGRSELDLTTRLGFGLIIGHIDTAHTDTHGDSAHSDVSHGDTAHGDSAHADSAHTDAVHIDTAHVDTAHVDSAHGDGAHGDSHSDTAHDDSHSDAAHTDTHGDSHTDSAHNDADHTDVAGEDHTDCIAHTDMEVCQHGDSVHFDNAHGDVAHGDVAHDDAHSDVSHIDTHVDSAHSDAHTDDAHSDAAHVDAAHVDTAHVDTAHGDAGHADAGHSDSVHSDSPHTDITHVDDHSDTAHGDS